MMMATPKTRELPRTSDMVRSDIREQEKRRGAIEREHDRLSASRPDLLLNANDAELDAHDAEQRRAKIGVERADARIEALKRELASVEAAEAQADRERDAVALETAAKAADAAIDRMRKATIEIDRARTELAIAITPEMALAYDPPSNAVAWGPSYLTKALFYNYRGDPMLDTLTPETVAARIAGHLLSKALPDLGIARIEDAQVRHADGQPTRILAPIDGAEAARKLLTDPLRARAAEMRRGPEASAAA